MASWEIVCAARMERVKCVAVLPPSQGSPHYTVLVGTILGNLHAMAFHNETNTLSVLWSISSQSEYGALRSIAAVPFPTTVSIYCGFDDGMVRWVSFDGSHALQHYERTYPCHSDFIRKIAVSPNGNGLLTCSDDKLIKFWSNIDARVPEPSVLSGHARYVMSVEWMADTLAVSCSLDSTIAVWEVAPRSFKGSSLMVAQSGKCVFSKGLSAVAVVPWTTRGTWCIAAGSDDYSIGLFRFSRQDNSLALCSKHVYHTNCLTSLMFVSTASTTSASKVSLYSSGEDGQVFVLDCEDLRDEVCGSHSQLLFAPSLSDSCHSHSIVKKNRIWALSVSESLRMPHLFAGGDSGLMMFAAPTSDSSHTSNVIALPPPKIRIPVGNGRVLFSEESQGQLSSFGVSWDMDRVARLRLALGFVVCTGLLSIWIAYGRMATTILTVHSTTQAQVISFLWWFVPHAIAFVVQLFAVHSVVHDIPATQSLQLTGHKISSGEERWMWKVRCSVVWRPLIRHPCHPDVGRGSCSFDVTQVHNLNNVGCSLVAVVPTSALSGTSNDDGEAISVDMKAVSSEQGKLLNGIDDMNVIPSGPNEACACGVVGPRVVVPMIGGTGLPLSFFFERFGRKEGALLSLRWQALVTALKQQEQHVVELTL